MRGIQYIIDDKGKKTAVQIDLEKYGELWEDFYDTLTVKSRKKEPRATLESVKKKLVDSGRL